MNDEDIRQLAARFGELIVPQLRDEIAAGREELRSFRRDTLTHFDSIYKRFDRLEDEFQALKAAVKRLETAFEEDRAALRGREEEMARLKLEIADLQERLARLEAESHQRVRN